MVVPYPDYRELSEKKARNRMELETGRQTVIRTMAGGLTDRLVKDYNLPQPVVTNFEDPDPRKWTIKVTVQGMDFEEDFWVFPSAELLATLMLLGMTR